MSSNKQVLKSIKTAIDKQNFDAAASEADDLIHNDNKNFMGDDAASCQNLVDKYDLFVKKHGSRSQQIHALDLLLPASPLYNLLEGRIPHPSQTYSRIIDAMELEEKAWINKEIGERRTRLGAKIDQVKLTVSRQAFAKFPLESLYQQMIGWSNDDEVRRSYEEKLFQRAYDTLVALSQEDKPSKRDEVLRMANGIVIIKHSFQPAWNVAVDWVDADKVEDWDAGILRDYIDLFPQSGLSKVLRGYLESDISPFGRDSDRSSTLSPEDSVAEDQVGQAERLILMVEGFEECTDSLLAHRMMAELYLHLEEFGNAVEVGERAENLCQTMSRKFDLHLQESSDSVNSNRATAMIYYQSPRYHPSAKELFSEILERKPTDTSSLMGTGMIFEEDEDFAQAVAFFEKAASREPDNLRISSELAWCRAMNQDLTLGLEELQNALSDILASKPVNLKMKSEVLYRIGYCMWHLDQSKSARKAKNGAYKFFIDSLQANPNYAPPYTMLGLYFEDYGKSKKRARTAFQKAFELSASEMEAAERLARSYADSAEWELVDLVAQRVIDSGKARPAPGSKKQAYSWPFAALGISQMNRQEYSKSIVSFQSALRISPSDYYSWVGLGESYHHAGRHIAATRAFSKAESLENKPAEEQLWFARYMLANVSREIGAFGDAICGYESVLAMKPNEFGVSVALLQTLAETAWSHLEKGMFGQAAETARKAFQTASQIAAVRSDVFNLWKSVGDACSVFGIISAEANSVDFEALVHLLRLGFQGEEFRTLADVDHLDGDNISLSANGTLTDSPSRSIQAADRCLQSAVLSYKRALHAASNNVHSHALSWYNLGWAEHQLFTFSTLHFGEQTRKKSHRFLKAAVRCFKRAIELEAGNSEFWNALGVVTTTLNPKIAQHSFIRSLHLNDRNAHTWTNLGTLYLLNEDIELANQAFTRGQSSDPDYAQAWLGQGLIALQYYHDRREARGLFEHAFSIAGSSSAFAKQRYTLSAFDHIRNTKSVLPSSPARLVEPLFALYQLQSQLPASLPFNHLTALFAERTDDYDVAIKALESVCSSIEQEYEATESVDSMSKFAQSKADLARALLAKGQYESAFEAAETSLDLSTEEDSNLMDQNDRRRWRLSAHLTAGLAHYHQASPGKAIPMFQSALQEADGDPDVVCLLAQVLWAQGKEEEKSLARDQLYSCVEEHPEHVGAATLLGVISVLDEDEEGKDAVQEELESLRFQDRLSSHDRAKVDRVLRAIKSASASIDEDSSEELRRLSEASKSVMLAPSQPQGWSAVATAASELDGCESESVHAAEQALVNALRAVPPRGDLNAEDLCESYSGTGRVGDSMVGIMVAPWSRDGWEALHEGIGQ
ncbi:MAG: hypothetical protein Q9227_001888 [Pyrenula ochraceoflavens]